MNLLTEEAFKEFQIKCTGGSIANDYCINEKCRTQNPFQCGERKCKCRQGHKLCLKAQIDSTLEMIQSKIVNTQEIKTSIEVSFDLLIDQLSHVRDNIISKMDYLKYHKLHQIQNQFMSLINTDQIDKFNSQQTAKLWKAITSNHAPKYDIFLEVSEEIDKFSHKITLNISQFESKVKQTFCKLPEYLVRSIQSKKRNLILSQQLKSSSVLQNNTHIIKRLIKMLPQTVGDIKLAYRASENEFNIKKYNQLCGNLNHTLIVCKTNQDKIIGGYTPLSFQSKPTNGNFVADQSNQSFFFSLSQNQKFPLKDNNKALYTDNAFNYLCFGYTEFQIKDQSFKPNSCRAFLSNASYYNSKYRDDKESNLKINGNQSRNFSTKDWQVWKVQFSPKKV